MTGIDLVVMALYFAAVLTIGAQFTSKQHDARDYFLGRRDIPWWAVMLSVVATETSALTVISIPGIAARSDLTFLQIPLGYLVGRIGVSIWLLPGYFRGEQETAYSRLETRFGAGTRKLASAVFMVIRALGDSVRVFATAIPLHIVTGLSIPWCIVIVAVVTLAYTLAGGIKAVIWVDVMQMALYVVAGFAAIAVAASLAGGLGQVFPEALEAGRLRTFDWEFSFSNVYTFWGGLIGGALLSAGSHGTDHLMVQRLLATRSLSDARKALVGSGVLVIVQFALFLLVGTFIWAAGADNGTLSSDEVFPSFIVNLLPAGLSGLVIAGIFAAAMSTVSSSLNSLASAATHDFYAPLTKTTDARKLLTVGRWATLGWAVVLAGGALAFQSNDQPVVVLALSIASITYGGLLGTYILGGISQKVRQFDVILTIVTATAAMLVIVLMKPGPFADLAWPWYVPLGTIIALGVGLGSSWLRSFREVS
ncbi:MAG: sodium:solute symporter [Gemmatimonadota bacterium]|nr:MAG: sodium:solute symporter [Gemmatimonadota bacterium]